MQIVPDAKNYFQSVTQSIISLMLIVFDAWNI